MQINNTIYKNMILVILLLIFIISAISLLEPSYASDIKTSKYEKGYLIKGISGKISTG